MSYTGFPSEIYFKDFTKIVSSFPKTTRDRKKYVFCGTALNGWFHWTNNDFVRNVLQVGNKCLKVGVLVTSNRIQFAVIM